MEHNHENPLANLDEATQIKIQELQMLEQAFQQLMMQKQAFQMELNETEFAIRETEKAKGDIFKIVANQVVLKTSKEDLIKDMKNKKSLIELRMKKIDSQEKEFSEKIESLREDIMRKISGKSKTKDNK